MKYGLRSKIYEKKKFDSDPVFACKYWSTKKTPYNNKITTNFMVPKKRIK